MKAKELNKDAYTQKINDDVKRKSLKDRVKLIKRSGIKEVQLPNKDEYRKLLWSQYKLSELQPKDQRSIKMLISSIKSFALLNFMHREHINDTTIVATENDALSALHYWTAIIEVQRLGISPYEYKVYTEVLLPLQKLQPGQGLSIRQINKKFTEIFHKPIDNRTFRYIIVPKYENAGIVEITENIEDKRSKLYLVRDIYANIEGDFLQTFENDIQ